MGFLDAMRDKLVGWDPERQEDTHSNQPKPRPQLVEPPKEK